MWLIKIGILPRPKKVPGGEKPKKPQKPKKEKEKPAGEEPKPKKGGTVKLIRDLIPVVLDTLKRFKHKLTIDSLTIIYTADCDDPFDNVMKYGYAWEAIGAVLPLLERNFRVKKRDLEALISFEGTGDTVYADARLTLRVWEIIYIACGLLPALKILLDWKKQPAGGKDEKDGKAAGK